MLSTFALRSLLAIKYDMQRYNPITAQKSQSTPNTTMFDPSINAVSNVHVRTNDITRTEFQHLQRPNAHNNVLPFSQMMIGPGVGTDSSEAAGNQGFHYSKNRMMPNDVYVHQRGQAGSLIPGKTIVNKAQSTPYLRKLRPERFFEVTDDYRSSAPGRSSTTNPTKRTQPNVKMTNRGAEVFGSGHASYVGTSAMTDRTNFSYINDTSSRGQHTPHVGPVARGDGTGYLQKSNNLAINDNERSTLPHNYSNLLPLNNPGQSIYNSNIPDKDYRPTLRGGVEPTPLTNLQIASIPNAHQTHDIQHMRTTEKELTQVNDYVGPAQSYLGVSSQQTQHDSISRGRLSKATLKEMSHSSYTGSARTQQNNPMSYANLMQNENYSNKETMQSNHMGNAGRMNIPIDYKYSATELREEMPISSRDNNLDRASQANLYLRNERIDVNPNKGLDEPKRLDSSILTDNILFPPIK